MSRILPEKYLVWALIAIIFFPLLKSLLPVVVPFLLGLGLALIAEPAVDWLHQKVGLPRYVATAIGVLGVFVLSITLLTFILSILLRQINHISQLLPTLTDTVIQGTALLQHWLLSLAESVPEAVQPVVNNMIGSLFQNGSGFLQHLVDQLPKMAGSALGRLSSGFIGLVTTILSAFMISARLPLLQQRVKQLIPTQIFSAMRGFRQTLGHWILAQGKLAGIAFILLWLGFLILRIPQGLLWAGLITLVDILPILGVGTVLLPWSLVSYLQGNPPKALGLAGIFLVIWLIRSILEPKLVGKELGLDPLVTLLCIYAGFRLWGIMGMLLAPMAAVCLVQLWRTGANHNKPTSPP